MLKFAKKRVNSHLQANMFNDTYLEEYAFRKLEQVKRKSV